MEQLTFLFLANPQDFSSLATIQKFHYKAGVYDAKLILGSFSTPNSLTYDIGAIKVVLPLPTETGYISVPQEASAGAGAQDPNNYKVLPEIKHVFRPDAKQAPFVVSLFFTAATLAPWLILVYGVSFRTLILYRGNDLLKCLVFLTVATIGLQGPVADFGLVQLWHPSALCRRPWCSPRPYVLVLDTLESVPAAWLPGNLGSLRFHHGTKCAQGTRCAEGKGRERQSEKVGIGFIFLSKTHNGLNIPSKIWTRSFRLSVIVWCEAGHPVARASTCFPLLRRTHTQQCPVESPRSPMKLCLLRPAQPNPRSRQREQGLQ